MANSKKKLLNQMMAFVKMQLKYKKKSFLLENRYPISFIESNSEKTERKKNLIDDGIKNIILCKLEKLEKEHFYLNSSCNLYQVAEELKTNPKYLSQVINQEKNSNFNNYINGLRIGFVINKLYEDEDFRDNKISYIRAFIGYNNCNTFNTAFKKEKGILPSYFINQLSEKNKVNG